MTSHVGNAPWPCVSKLRRNIAEVVDDCTTMGGYYKVIVEKYFWAFTCRRMSSEILSSKALLHDATDLRGCYLRRILAGLQDLDFCNNTLAVTLLNISLSMHCMTSCMIWHVLNGPA